MLPQNRLRFLANGQIRRASSLFPETAFVPVPVEAFALASQHSQIAEIYRIAAERTQEQLRPKRSWLPEFSRN